MQRRRHDVRRRRRPERSYPLVLSAWSRAKDSSPRTARRCELGARALDILIALVSRPNEVVSKRELMAQVWPDVTVEEGSLRFHIASLRKALGDGKDGARYITTLRRAGLLLRGADLAVERSAPDDVPCGCRQFSARQSAQPPDAEWSGGPMTFSSCRLN